MHRPLCPILVLAFLLWSSFSARSQCTDAIVSLDGTGDFTSIQAAIDAAPAVGNEPFVIYIQNGIYEEKLFIKKNFITLIGQDRDSTIITTAVLRRVWREANPNDWGAATINIGDSTTDLTLANLTVRNNFADVYPDFPRNNDHTFAIRGGGHRVILLNCNITATGGDTLSLWNTRGGMFYHNRCYFEGYVDYVCPRGYCYITDSEFYGHNLSASIWHDGSGGEDHKFVIRNSSFDGAPGFPLGRHHRDAAFYLLDNRFSAHMADTLLYHTGTNELQWGRRVFYHDNHREPADYGWHADNLHEAPGRPHPDSITAQWTFNGRWDPESQLDGLLPFAFLPMPAIAADNVPLKPELRWVSGHCAREHYVYFGTSENPKLVKKTTKTSFRPGRLKPGTRYYWRVDAMREDGTPVRGELWSFWTEE